MPNVTRFASIWVAVTACSAVSAYPESRTETSLDACSDGQDQDLDGLTDCEDPDCDGWCVESGEACEDERDNDGDALFGLPLVDGLDPACWDRALREERRCTWTSGVLYELFRFRREDLYPDADWVTTGTAVDQRWIAGWGKIVLGPGQFVATAKPTVGALRELSIRMVFEARNGASAELRLFSERLGNGPVVYIRTEGGGAFGRLEDERGRSTEEMPLFRYGTGIHELRLLVSTGATPEWTLFTSTEERLTMPVDPNWRVDEPVSVRIVGTTEVVGTAFSVGVVRVFRNAVDDCGREVDSALLNEPSLRAVTESPVLQCVVLGALSHSSRNGSTWNEGRTPLQEGDLAVAYSEEFERFEGTRLDPETGELFLIASSDCSRWREAPAGTPMRGERARLVGFDIVPGFEGGARRIHLVVGDDAPQLVELASPTGLPFSYVEVSRTPWPRATWAEGAPLSVGRVGGDRWIVGPGSDPRTLALYTLSAEDALLTVDDPVVAPSGKLGTFDRYRIERGHLVPRPSTRWSTETSPTLRLFFFAQLFEDEPGYEDAFTRRGVSWVDLSFEGSERGRDTAEPDASVESAADASTGASGADAGAP